jgi:hypothetical protein
MCFLVLATSLNIIVCSDLGYYHKFKFIPLHYFKVLPKVLCQSTALPAVTKKYMAHMLV